MGLREIQARYGEYWSAHIANSHRRILEAAGAAKGRSTALVLGAGNCIEIPLEALAQRFERVVLADLDKASMEEAVTRLPPELQQKVDLRRVDVTSFATALMQETKAAVESARTGEELFARLGKVYEAVSPGEHSPALPVSDLVVSSLVLSELDRYPRTYADRLIRRKFSAPLTSWSDYERAKARLQRVAVEDHVHLLAKLRASEGAVYFADTISRGPFREAISPLETKEVLLRLLPQISERRFFEKIRQDEALRKAFTEAFRKKRGRGSVADAEETRGLLRRLSSAPEDFTREERAAAAEIVLQMLCHERFPVSAEIGVLETMLELYEAQSARAFEPLTDLRLLASAWAKKNLRPAKQPEAWWWIEFPCSALRGWGAFKVQSWILAKDR